MHRVGRFSGAPPETEPLVDRFTIGHVAWGTMLGLAAVPWWLVLGQAVLWELVENPVKRAFPRVFPSARPDDFPAAAADVAAVMAGWGAMRLLPRGPEPAIWRAPPGWE